MVLLVFGGFLSYIMFGCLLIIDWEKHATAVRKCTIHPNVILNIKIRVGQYQFHCPLFTFGLHRFNFKNSKIRGRTTRRTDVNTDVVTTSVLELLIAAKNEKGVLPEMERDFFSFFLGVGGGKFCGWSKFVGGQIFWWSAFMCVLSSGRKN